MEQRSSRRFVAFASALAVALLGPSAADAVPPGAVAGDHVLDLVGDWSCRTAANSTVRMAFTADGATIRSHSDVRPERGLRFTIDDRYSFDPMSSSWKVRTGIGAPFAFNGTAPPWTSRDWSVDGVDLDGTRMRMATTWLGDRRFRRSFGYVGPDGTYRPYSVSVCRSGDEPPAPGACIPGDVPAMLMTRALRVRPPPNARGRVTVHIELDDRGNVRTAHVVRSDDARLDPAALDGARWSTYAPATHDCVPAADAGDFTFDFR